MVLSLETFKHGIMMLQVYKFITKLPLSFILKQINNWHSVNFGDQKNLKYIIFEAENHFSSTSSVDHGIEWLNF